MEAIQKIERKNLQERSWSKRFVEYSVFLIHDNLEGALSEETILLCLQEYR